MSANRQPTDAAPKSKLPRVTLRGFLVNDPRSPDCQVAVARLTDAKGGHRTTFEQVTGSRRKRLTALALLIRRASFDIKRPALVKFVCNTASVCADIERRGLADHHEMRKPRHHSGMVNGPEAVAARAEAIKWLERQQAASVNTTTGAATP